jgi:hypothetical protein
MANPVYIVKLLQSGFPKKFENKDVFLPVRYSGLAALLLKGFLRRKIISGQTLRQVDQEGKSFLVKTSARPTALSMRQSSIAVDASWSKTPIDTKNAGTRKIDINELYDYKCYQLRGVEKRFRAPRRVGSAAVRHRATTGRKT